MRPDGTHGRGRSVPVTKPPKRGLPLRNGRNTDSQCRERTKTDLHISLWCGCDPRGGTVAWHFIYGSIRCCLFINIKKISSRARDVHTYLTLTVSHTHTHMYTTLPRKPVPGSYREGTNHVSHPLPKVPVRFTGAIYCTNGPWLAGLFI